MTNLMSEPRIMGLAVPHLVATGLMAGLYSHMSKVPLLVSLVLAVLTGIVVHWSAGVNTPLNAYLGINISNGKENFTRRLRKLVAGKNR